MKIAGVAVIVKVCSRSVPGMGVAERCRCSLERRTLIVCKDVWDTVIGRRCVSRSADRASEVIAYRLEVAQSLIWPKCAPETAPRAPRPHEARIHSREDTKTSMAVKRGFGEQLEAFARAVGEGEVSREGVSKVRGSTLVERPYAEVASFALAL